MRKTLIKSTFIAKSVIKKLFTMWCLLQCVISSPEHDQLKFEVITLSLQTLADLQTTYRTDAEISRCLSAAHSSMQHHKIYEAECAYQEYRCYKILADLQNKADQGQWTAEDEENKIILTKAADQYFNRNLEAGHALRGIN
jgi:hypothetical protein